MTMNVESYLSSYSPVGDILVMAILMVITVLIRVAYIKQSREFTILRYIMISLVAAAICNILFHQLLTHVSVISLRIV